MWDLQSYQKKKKVGLKIIVEVFRTHPHQNLLDKISFYDSY